MCKKIWEEIANRHVERKKRKWTDMNVVQKKKENKDTNTDMTRERKMVEQVMKIVLF